MKITTKYCLALAVVCGAVATGFVYRDFQLMQEVSRRWDAYEKGFVFGPNHESRVLLGFISCLVTAGVQTAALVVLRKTRFPLLLVTLTILSIDAFLMWKLFSATSEINMMSGDYKTEVQQFAYSSFYAQRSAIVNEFAKYHLILVVAAPLVFLIGREVFRVFKKDFGGDGKANGA